MSGQEQNEGGSAKQPWQYSTPPRLGTKHKITIFTMFSLHWREPHSTTSVYHTFNSCPSGSDPNLPSLSTIPPPPQGPAGCFSLAHKQGVKARTLLPEHPHPATGAQRYTASKAGGFVLLSFSLSPPRVGLIPFPNSARAVIVTRKRGSTSPYTLRETGLPFCTS